MADKIINIEEMNRIANEMANSVNSKSLEEIASVANSCVIASLGSLEDAGVSRELAKSVSSGYAVLAKELQSKASNYQEKIVEINKNMQKIRSANQNYNPNNQQGNNTAIIQNKNDNSVYVSGVSTNNNQQSNSIPASSVIQINPQKRPVTGSVEKLPNYDVNSRDKIVNLPNYDVNSKNHIVNYSGRAISSPNVVNLPNNSINKPNVVNLPNYDLNSRDKIVNYSDRSVIKPNVANSSNKSNINISKTI